MQTAIKTTKMQITLFEDHYISARGGKSVYIDYGQQLKVSRRRRFMWLIATE